MPLARLQWILDTPCNYAAGNDGPDVDEGEDEGVGRQSEENVAEIEGKEAEDQMLTDLGLGEAAQRGRGYRGHVEVKH